MLFHSLNPANSLNHELLKTIQKLALHHSPVFKHQECCWIHSPTTKWIMPNILLAATCMQLLVVLGIFHQNMNHHQVKHRSSEAGVDPGVAEIPVQEALLRLQSSQQQEEVAQEVDVDLTGLFVGSMGSDEGNGSDQSGKNQNQRKRFSVLSLKNSNILNHHKQLTQNLWSKRSKRKKRVR